MSDASFHKGEPFLPFQQLLGCLPAGSRQFLPSGYQWLMTHAESPLLDFFPADFQVRSRVCWCEVKCIAKFLNGAKLLTSHREPRLLFSPLLLLLLLPKGGHEREAQPLGRRQLAAIY